MGHALDGDSRRRQLMLDDYISNVGSKFTVPWEGWLLSALLVEENKVVGLHDHDYIHNGKKLVNPLNSPIRLCNWVKICVVLNTLGKYTINSFLTNMVYVWRM